jgi:putative transposase
MKYDPEIHHRRTIRLKGHDYSSTGMYFVTTCVKGHECMFGCIRDNVIHLSDAGRVAETVWTGLPDRFPMVTLDEFVVMPNHFHGIVVIAESAGDKGAMDMGAMNGGAMNCAPTDDIPFDHVGARFIAPRIDTPRINAPGFNTPRFPVPATPTLGEIIRVFKAVSARLIRKHHVPEFAWQRNYYERIIRDERELNNIREYIVNNPTRWEDDPENRQGVPDECIIP